MFAFRRLRRRAVVVNLTTGRAFRGILWAKRGPLLVLRSAEIVESSSVGSTSMPVDGEVVVERRFVEFVQVLS